MKILLLLPALVLGNAALPSGEQAPRHTVLSSSDYEAISAAYTSLLEDHTAEVRKARGLKARRELRAAHPIHSYWPRFEALAETDGRGLLLMITHLKDRGMMRKATVAEAQRLYTELGASHLSAPWFGQALERLARDQRLVGVPFTRDLLRRTVEGTKNPATRASSLYSLGRMLLVSQDGEDRAEGKRLIDALASDHPESPEAKLIAEELFELLNLGLGCEAPDFEASTLEGHQFKLSDYRGKVVLLDFYGFW